MLGSRRLFPLSVVPLVGCSHRLAIIRPSVVSHFSGVRSYCYTPKPFVDGTSDFAFKKLFRVKEILIPVLNDAFLLTGEREITDIDYNDPHHPGSPHSSKATTFDLSCKTKRGERIIIEMQRTWQTYFYKRALYDWALEVVEQDKPHAEQTVIAKRRSKNHEKGETIRKPKSWNYNFEPVYQFSVCDFPVFPDDQQLKYEPILRGMIHFNGYEPVLNYIPPFRLCFMQLSNFPQTNPLVGSPAEKIGTLLKNLNKFNSKDELPKVLRNDPLVERAIDVLTTANLSREEKADYERDLKHSRDEYARQETFEILQLRVEESKRKNEETERKFEESKRKNEETERKFEESKREIEESKREIEESKRKNEESDQKIEELLRKIEKLTKNNKE